ncbi:MAG: aminomethyl-transferring glycine dehydrogenase subunit GcvPB [bacterium]
MESKLIFERSVPGRKAFSLPPCDVPERSVSEAIPPNMLRGEPVSLPEISEMDLVRHFTFLSSNSFGVDSSFYPLGSCTMKYNPKVNERIARMERFSGLHPLLPEECVQGALEVMYSINRYLCEITGMEEFSLQPIAGAQGELTGLLIIAAYHRSRGERRTKIIVPDSAHGTNPASAHLCGFQIVEVPSDNRGGIDVGKLEEALGGDVAGLMLTNPNTLGLFDENILRVAEMVHSCGGLLYYDGANLNAILGICRPGDMGFDIVHLNLHKTFSTPHGGGGPGAGPVGVKGNLADFLPSPIVVRRGDEYILDDDRPKSIGRLSAFHGNFGVVLRVYAYIRTLGARGLREVGEGAVLSANYLMSIMKKRLGKYLGLPYDRRCMHEFVMSAKVLKEATGVRALDVAKRLLDYGFHPPTVYFPLIVEEALMIEPTETESKETLDSFVSALEAIMREAEEYPELLLQAPHTKIVGRLDEVRAARHPDLRFDRAKNITSDGEVR